MPYMNIASKCQIKSTSYASTERLAAKIGARLRGGEVIELISDLGGGKTVFTKGLAKGAGSLDEVTSPTFTISKIYRCPQFAIHHFDFYRLNDPGIVQIELQEVIGDTGVVTVIEWADVVKDALPANTITINIAVNGADERLLEIHCPKSREYLLKGLKC
jgi:tRNA threonylcarbamoyladenosine biosynthesis protein TsaE